MMSVTKTPPSDLLRAMAALSLAAGGKGIEVMSEVSGSSSADRRANSRERKMRDCMPNWNRLAPNRNRLDVPTRAADVLINRALETLTSGPVAAWTTDCRLSM